MNGSIRDCRRAAGLTQADFAALLDLPLETLRTWDSGRRKPTAATLVRIMSIVAGLLEQRYAARVHATDPEIPDYNKLLGLLELSRLIGVSVYRLREAARDGRLLVAYSNRSAFGRPVPRATLAAGEEYKRRYFGKKQRWVPRPEQPNCLSDVPANYDQALKEVRARLNLSQAQLAAKVGAAGRAVVYQWESRKRKPTSFFWRKVLVLGLSQPQ